MFLDHVAIQKKQASAGYFAWILLENIIKQICRLNKPITEAKTTITSLNSDGVDHGIVSNLQLRLSQYITGLTMLAVYVTNFKSNEYHRYSNPEANERKNCF